MNKFVLAFAAVIALGAGSARADEKAAPAPAAKPDCAAQDAAVTEAKKAIKDVPKVDLSSCKDKKGKEKFECEKPLNEGHIADVKAAALKFKEADTAAKCCKNPKAKSCAAK